MSEQTQSIFLRFKAFVDDKASVALSMLGRTASGVARGVSTIFRGLGGMMDNLTGGAKKFAGALGSVVSSFMTLGPAAAIITAVGASFDWLTDKVADFLGYGKAVIQRLQEIGEAMKEAYREAKARDLGEQLNRVTTALAAATTEAEKASKYFDQLANSYLKVAAAANSVAKAQSDLRLSQLANEREQAMLGAGGDKGAAAMIGAGYDVKIAQQKLADAMEQSAKDIETARQKAAADEVRLTSARQRLDAAQNAVAVAEEELAKARRLAANNAQEFGPHLKQIEAKHAAAVNALADATIGVKVASDNLAAARSAVTAAELNQERQILDAQTGLAAAERAKAELELADAARREAEERKAQLESLKSEKDKLKTMEDEYRDARTELAEITRERVDAERKAKEAEEEYYRHYDQNVLNAAIYGAETGKGLGGGRGQYVSNRGGEANVKATGKALEDAIRDGTVKTVAEAQRFQREYSKNYEKTYKQEAIDRAADKQRYERIMSQNDKSLSAQDRAFKKQYEAIQDAATKEELEKIEAQTRAQELADAERVKAEEAQKQAEDIKNIRQKLEALGLK